MTKKELNLMEETELEENYDEKDSSQEEKTFSFKVKCKPTYNFQSIEFEWDIKEPHDLEYMFLVYKQLLDGLMEIAPTQPSSKEVVPEHPATEKQLEILKKFKIKHSPNVSKEEADKLIKQSLSKK